MLKKPLNNQRFIEIMKFGINGGVCFILEYGIFLLSLRIFHAPYQLATVISFCFAVVANYIICKLWVFEKTSDMSLKAVLVFAGSSVIGLLWNLLFMYIQVDLLHIIEEIAKIVSSILVMIWNYFMKRKAMYMGNKGDNKSL